MEGFIAIHRKILDWEWYCNPNVKILFLHCLLKANYAEKKWQGETIKRGEFVTSIATLAGELGMTFQQVRTALDKLKTTNEITSRTTNKFTILTICNYDKYQTNEVDKQQAEQQPNNKQTTNKQQTNNNNIINNNNNNKENKETNIIPPYNIPPQGDLFGEEIKPNKKRKKDDDFDIVVYLQSRGVTEQHIQDYIKVRKAKKAVNTLTAMQRIDTQIQLAHISWDEAVACCIEWDWKGFNHDWYIKKLQTQNNNGIYQSRQRQDSRRQGTVSDFENAKPEDYRF